MSSPPQILIVGAGLAGSLLAVILAREGFHVHLYERRPDPRAKGFLGGRSINLALSARGIDALNYAGLADQVMSSDALPMRGRMIHSPAGALAFQPYSSNPADAINSVSRGGLNLTLLRAAAQHKNVRLHFDHCCTDADFNSPRPAAIFARVTHGGLPAPGAPTLRIEADLILAADGAFSPVRTAMQKTDRFEYSQSYLSHAYKELHIPAADGGFALDPAALHIWPRKSAMMIALPNRDHSFTCTLFWPQEGGEGDHSFANLAAPDQILAFFTKHYPDAVPLMPTLVHDFQHNPTSSLVTIRCFPWQIAGQVALLGDAAHALVPFYGQGMNAAFEDCKALVESLKRCGASAAANTLGNTRAALEEFQQQRKPHADAIADMALENFIEMRDKVGSPAFLYRKKVEQALHKLFPDRCEPQYHLVSFSTVPYAQARARGQQLDALYDAIITQLPPGSDKTLGDDPWLARLGAIAGSLNVGRAEGSAVVERAGVREAESHSPFSSASLASFSATSAFASKILDISPLLSPRTKVWPGDTPLSREILADIAPPRGDNITLSTLHSTVHLGAHADGPNHYIHPGRSIDQQPLNYYLGPCHVIEAKVAQGARIKPTDLIGGLNTIASIKHPRVLIRTNTFPNPELWTDDFAALSVELIDALAQRGVITIGIDTPSVDLFSSKDLPAHQAIARHDIAILEGLVLRDVAPGDYDLIALPLKLEAFDASPVRAILRPLPT